MTRRAFGLAFVLALAAFAEDDVILRSMQDEIQRSRSLRAVNPELPYYIEYALHDGESVSGSATLGALIGSRRLRYRLPRIQVRVGDYAFDNTNFIGTDFFGGAPYDTGQFPLDATYSGLRRHLWLATDSAYKGAIEALSRKRAALKNVTLNEQTPDFSKAAPLVRLDAPRLNLPDQPAWEARARKLSAVFLDYPVVLGSAVEFEGGQSTMYLVNSEGSRIRIPEGMMSLRVVATAQAPDGMLVRDAAQFVSLDVARMPSDVELERGVREVAENATALANAPLGEAYTGPVLFEGIAGAQLFAEVLGGNLALPRKPVMPPGRSFPLPTSELEGRLGVRILPEWMDVVDDPTQVEWRGHPLFGHYDVDLEGVAPAPLTLVEKGVLKNFLLTRQPVKNFQASNGRARMPGRFGAKAAGFGNLFVKATGGLSEPDLKKKLIDLCRERDKPYGVMVRKLDFPSTASPSELRRQLTAMAQSGGSANPVSAPLLAYRVYADGREELVRGLRFRGLNARSLKDILAASADVYAFDFLDNTAPFALVGGAGFVSETSAIAPSVLIDDLEMEKAQDELPKPPVVPPPPLTR